MTESTQTTPTSPTPQAGIADAFGQLSEQTAELVREEIAAAQREMWAKGRQMAPGIALVGAAGLFGIFATASAYRFSLRLLEKMLPPSVAAFVAMSGSAAAAVAAALAGVERIRTAPVPLPTTTARSAAQTVKETSQEVRDGSSSPPALDLRDEPPGS